MRTPADIAQHLQDDLRRSADTLAELHGSVEQRVRNPVSRAAQRTAMDELDALRTLLDDPWFGYVEVEEDGERRSYRIGRASNPRARIVDWRHPLARIFYEWAPGETYDRPGGGALIDGVLEARATVAHRELAVQHAEWRDLEGVTELRREGDGFVDVSLAVGPVVDSTRGLGDILAYITREQWALIRRASDQPLIIQGKAGSVKTTVALHRIAYLAYEDDAQAASVRPENMLIVRFNAALRTFVQTSLAPHEVQNARLKTFHPRAQNTNS